jgi:putative aldouronate transport system permease protein
LSTATQQAAPRTKAYDPLTGEKWRLAKRMSSFYVLLIPPVVVLFIFHYIPIYGAVIAFKDFHYGKGILAEQEVVEGFRHPQRCTSSRSESTC